MTNLTALARKTAALKEIVKQCTAFMSNSRSRIREGATKLGCQEANATALAIKKIAKEALED